MQVIFADKKKKPRQDSLAVQYSKTLSFILRHGAEKEGFTMDQQGYVPISEILDWNVFHKNDCKSKDI